MAMQEKQHAGLLQFCLADGLFASDLPDESEIRKYSGLFRRLERRARDLGLNVNEAFELASELEGSEVNAIYCHLTNRCTPHNSNNRIGRYYGKKADVMLLMSSAGSVKVASALTPMTFRVMI